MMAGSESKTARPVCSPKIGLGCKPHYHRAPGRVRQRGKYAIERGALKLNHMVQYQAAGRELTVVPQACRAGYWPL